MRRTHFQTRELIACLFLALAAISLAGCGGGQRATPLRIGIHFWPGLEFMQLAQDQGFFAKEGVDVELIRYSSLADEQRAYENGLVDGAYVSLDQLIILHDRGIPARMALVGDLSKGGDGIVTRPGFKTLEEIRGARVGVTIGATNHFTLIKALQQAGMNEGDVEIVNLPEDSIMQAFAQGTVDVAVTWEPELARHANRQDARILFTSASFPDLIIDGVVFAPETLKNRRQEIDAMIRGWNLALDHARHNPQEAFNSIARYEKSNPALMNTIFKGIEQGTPEVNRRVLGDAGKPGTGVEAARQVAEFLLRFKLIQAAPKPEGLFEPRPAP